MNHLFFAIVEMFLFTQSILYCSDFSLRNYLSLWYKSTGPENGKNVPIFIMKERRSMTSNTVTFSYWTSWSLCSTSLSAARSEQAGYRVRRQCPPFSYNNFLHSHHHKSSLSPIPIIIYQLRNAPTSLRTILPISNHGWILIRIQKYLHHRAINTTQLLLLSLSVHLHLFLQFFLFASPHQEAVAWPWLIM